MIAPLDIGPRRPRGFTLVELLIVMGLVALLAVLAVPALEGISGANARRAAGELAGSMRALYGIASLRGATCRMALDLDQRAWWAECAPGRVGMSQEAAADPEAEPGGALGRADAKDRAARAREARTRFRAYSDRLVEKRELPGEASFGPIHLEGRRDAVDRGVVYVHFFAGGQAQRAWVPVVDGRNHYTVVVEPFTGRARVVVGPVEVRE